jgi:hypothetical protein
MVLHRPVELAGVMRNFESPVHAFGAGDVFETATPL